MKKKHPEGCSVLLIPSSGDKPISLFVSYKALKVIFVVLIVCFIGIVSSIFQYQALQQKIVDYDSVVAENAELKAQVLNFTDTTARLQAQVAEMKNLDSNIRNMLELEEPQISYDLGTQVVASAEVTDTNEEEDLFIHNAEATVEEPLQSSFASFIQDNSRYQLSNRGSLDRTIVELTETLETLDEVIPQQGDSLEDLESAVEEHKKLQQATPSIWPAEGIITSYYGYRSSPFGSGYDFHHGVDIGAAYGSPVKATADGEVILASYSYGYGYYMIIDHGMGFSTLYAHLRKFKAGEGQQVERGEIIAYSGNSGNSTGPHLHYEVRINGNTTNPTAYLP